MFFFLHGAGPEGETGGIEELGGGVEEGRRVGVFVEAHVDYY